MMLSSLHRDHITLIKKDGTKFENIQSSVQTNKIFTYNTKIIVDEGDIFSRKLPNGKIEYYEVINPVFCRGLGGIPANYQIEVRKTTQAPKQPSISINAAGNAKVNVNSVDNSINNSFNNDLEIFDKLLSIAGQIPSSTEITKSIIEMKNSINDKESFKEKYNNFIQSAAAHMTLFAPLITELTKYL